MSLCGAGEDIAWDLAPFVSQVVLSGKKWIKEEFATMSGPFGAKANMLRRPWVSKMHADGRVEFEDGSCVESIDVVMFCTGAAFLHSITHSRRCAFCSAAVPHWYHGICLCFASC